MKDPDTSTTAPVRSMTAPVRLYGLKSDTDYTSFPNGCVSRTGDLATASCTSSGGAAIAVEDRDEKSADIVC